MTEASSEYGHASGHGIYVQPSAVQALPTRSCQPKPTATSAVLLSNGRSSIKFDDSRQLSRLILLGSQDGQSSLHALCGQHHLIELLWHFCVQKLWEKSFVRVCVRFRPSLDKVLRHRTGVHHSWLRSPDDRGVDETPFTVDERSVSGCGKRYEFDLAFNEHTSQHAVYERVAQPYVKDLVRGQTGAIIAYGHTGAGKSYSLWGGGI